MISEIREKLREGFGILCCGEVLPHSFEIPQRGIDGVVLGCSARIREIVGQHSPVNVSARMREAPFWQYRNGRS